MDVERMITLAKKWGTVPRTLLQHTDTQDWEVEALYRQRSKAAVAQCQVMMDGGVSLDFPDALSPFYFLRPMKLDGNLYHKLGCMSVPTQALRALLAEGLQKQRNVTKLEFYHTLSQVPETRQTARFIYESWFHSFVCAGKKIQCEWLAQGSDDDVAQLPIKLVGVLLPTTRDAATARTPPFYWLPPHANFPGIDSALVLDDEIFVFQVTISTEHNSPIKGLQKLRNLLPNDLKNLPWRVVFVGAENLRIKQVAECWVGQICFPTKETRVPVAWSEVDPAQDDVTYTACNLLIQ